ncbi:hypothetical protein [Streptomyces clavuligerus]|nr:hypothetical protein [Streptomyces clavuligerus]ANW20161.1 hypothetical protein BB341_19045 [Streptomyces clavuligerus]AXU14788.1 hypothetical protein D1794_19865 [Streptomyces clavuligerus]EDY50241.1 conserved hypothetical protein [Streptomyces clavuligerus]MBY6304817.1 hypothetical protein [Streptomyces clavuligerus]QCS07558.1 hypothetical protein CRV15_19220 [Streptomyces clavuligerus]
MTAPHPAPTPDPAPLALTGHPLQRAGAWAVTVMAGRKHPEEVSADDLNQVMETVLTDAAGAGAAAKTDSSYDWWKVLFALYPNAKVTHAGRPRDAAALRGALTPMFAPDGTGPGQLPCTFCGTPATAVWAKSMLPLFDSNTALNTLPPGVPGWPVCRGCRIAMWALPYGSWVTAGSATVLSCETTAAEREFALRNVRRAQRIVHAGFEGSAAGVRPELVTLRALRAVGSELSATTLWSFKNDNQEPWLRVTRTRRAVPRFLAAVEGNAALRRGWRLLELALTQRDTDGRVTAQGSVEAARLLFEPEDGRGRYLPSQLHQLLSDTERWPLRDRTALTRLALHYEKEVYGMAPDLEGVATLIVDWIEHGSGSPRGRLAEYKSAGLSDYRLGLLLHQACFRLSFDGRRPVTGPDDWRPFLEKRPRAWEHRMLLTAEVFRLLHQRGIAVGDPPEDPKEREQVERQVNQPLLDTTPEPGYDDYFGGA